jgi:hypothetical protein
MDTHTDDDSAVLWTHQHKHQHVLDWLLSFGNINPSVLKEIRLSPKDIAFKVWLANLYANK